MKQKDYLYIEKKVIYNQPVKYFCFRFDVDTHKCLRDGVPNLIKLADELDVKFTFFINFGRSVHQISALKNIVKGDKKRSSVKALSPLKKLGLNDYLFAAIYNPVIGQRYPKVLKKLATTGHEIGLHGAKNHEEWLRYAKAWSSQKIKDELSWGLVQLKKYNKNSEYGFASPGCNGSKKINKVLSELGFLYVADIHTDKPAEKIRSSHDLKEIPTNLAGEPGGVGYVEHSRAKGMTDSQIISDFKKRLGKRKKLAITYDHPYYVGVKELDIIREMVMLAKKMGYKVTTMKEIAKHS